MGGGEAFRKPEKKEGGESRATLAHPRTAAVRFPRVWQEGESKGQLIPCEK